MILRINGTNGAKRKYCITVFPLFINNDTNIGVTRKSFNRVGEINKLQIK